MYIVTLLEGRTIVDVTAHRSSTNAYNSIEQWVAGGENHKAKLRCEPRCKLDVSPPVAVSAILGGK